MSTPTAFRTFPFNGSMKSRAESITLFVLLYINVLLILVISTFGDICLVSVQYVLDAGLEYMYAAPAPLLVPLALTKITSFLNDTELPKLSFARKTSDNSSVYE